MKRLYQLSILLALLLPATASAYDFMVDGIYYNKSGNEVSVTYKNNNYNSYSGAITIPKTVTYFGTTYTVTTIGNEAFKNSTNLTNVNIPNTVTSIEYSAFNGCNGLTRVYNPNSIITIGDYAFYGCTSLTSFTIPNSVTTIGFEAFTNTAWYDNQPDGLVYAGLVAYKYKGTMPDGTSITFMDGTLGIGSGAFSGCSGLTDVNIPNSVTSIGDAAFEGCSGLTDVTIGSSVTSIGDAAFEGCSGLTDVTIGSSVTSIGDAAFSSCTGLTRIYIPNSVTSIGCEAFYDCSGLTDVIIPNSVIVIGRVAFSGCSGLTDVNIPNSVTSIGDAAFESCSGLTDVTIGSSVTSIGDAAFRNCNGLTCITIPNSVTSIGDNAFQGCTALETLYFNAVSCADFRDGNSIPFGNDPNLSTIIIGGEVQHIPAYFAYCQVSLNEITIPNAVTSIGPSAFSGCSGLTDVTIGSSVTSIGDHAFWNCSGLTCITIPNSVTSIGEFAFSRCSSLTSVTIGDSVTVISSWAFLYCSSLSSVNIPKSVTAIGNSAFQGCTALETLYFNAVSCADFSLVSRSPFDNQNLSSIIIGDEVQHIPAYFAYDLSKLTNLTIPNSVKSIGDFAFQGCTTLDTLNFNAVSCEDFNSTASYRPFYNLNISSINIGDEVQHIPAYFAYGMTKPTSIAIPNSVISIGDDAFDGCSGLVNITFSNSVTVIGDNAFRGCSGLTSIDIPKSVTAIGNSAFQGCTALETLYFNAVSCADFRDSSSSPFYNLNLWTIIIGNDVQRIPAYFAYGMKNITDITIPTSVTSIGDYAFYGCELLGSIEIPNSLVSIGDYAFAGCSWLDTVYSRISDLSAVSVGSNVFYLKTGGYSQRTLYVPSGRLADYQSEMKWSQYFGSIVEMDGVEPGDVNGDGGINISDVTALIDLLLSGGEISAGADVNGDGQVNISDVTALIDRLLSGN